MRRLLVWCVLVASARTSLAQPTGNDTQVLFEAGRELLAHGHPAEACAKFEAAIARDPGALGPLMNLGLCNEQLDRLATALRWLRRAKQRSVDLGLAKSNIAIDDKLRELARRVAAIELSPRPPASATIRIDGTPVDAQRDRIEVDAGPHAIEITGAGTPIRRDVVARDGESATIDLTPVPPPPPPPPKPVVVTEPASHTAAYAIGGAGVGLLGGVLAVGLIGRHEYFAPTSDAATKAHWVDIVRYGDTSAFVVGVAALGVSTYLFLRGPSSVVIAPTLGEHAAGAVLVAPF